MDRALRLARFALETSDVGLALCVSLVALQYLWRLWGGRVNPGNGRGAAQAGW